jgi:hypothetical protein
VFGTGAAAARRYEPLQASYFDAQACLRYLLRLGTVHQEVWLKCIMIASAHTNIRTTIQTHRERAGASEQTAAEYKHAFAMCYSD